MNYNCNKEDINEAAVIRPTRETTSTLVVKTITTFAGRVYLHSTRKAIFIFGSLFLDENFENKKEIYFFLPPGILAVLANIFERNESADSLLSDCCAVLKTE